MKIYLMKIFLKKILIYFGPSCQIIKPLASQSETALTSHYVFFDKQAFADFKEYCQKYRDDLSKNKFIKEYLTQEDIDKLSKGSSNPLDDDVVMKLFIAINHTAGYGEEGHIGLKLVENFGEEFALKWFKLRATSAHIESCKKDDGTTISISNFANIDGNIFGTNRGGFENSLPERQAVVLAQLQSALSKIATLPDDSEIKESIEALKEQVGGGNYLDKPGDWQIKQATKAITYANLINAMHSLPEDSVMLYFKPNLFLPDLPDLPDKKKGGRYKKCKPEDFEKMVQDVVDATERSIISDRYFYRKGIEATQLYTFSMINNVGDIKLIAKELKEKSPNSKLVVGVNGAVHQIQPGGMEDWNPTVGGHFVRENNWKRLGFEESMRKLFNELRLGFLNTDVKITAELLGGRKKCKLVMQNTAIG